MEPNNNRKPTIDEVSDSEDDEDYVMPNAHSLPRRSLSGRGRSKSESKLDDVLPEETGTFARFFMDCISKAF